MEAVVLTRSGLLGSCGFRRPGGSPGGTLWLIEDDDMASWLERSAMGSVALVAGLVVACGGTDQTVNLDRAGGASAASGSTGDISSPCVAATCDSLGANCGQVPDGCGSVISCGQCADGEICGAAGPNLCGAGACSPRTCADLGAACGSVADGCGQIVACPDTCVAPQVCGSYALARPVCTRRVSPIEPAPPPLLQVRQP